MSAGNMRTDAGRRDTVTPLRLRLRANGYSPVPVSGPDMRINSAGKRPVMKGWRQVCLGADEDKVRRWTTDEPGCTNTGILCDHLAAVDIDVPVLGLAEQIEVLAIAKLGATRLRRIGRAPKVLLVYRTTSPLPKMETPELILPNAIKVQVEILGAGQQFVAYGIHPDTNREYEWPESGPDVVRLADLPVVTETALREFVAAVEDMLRAVGGRTEKEINADAEKTAEGHAEPARPETVSSKPKAASRPRSGAGGDNFFKAVNSAALDNLDAWVPHLFEAKAKRQETGGYRVTSADLGRSLEEDLSIHPSGIQDFGSRQGRSPIDLMMEFGDVSSLQEAAFKLCEWLGQAPADLGWKETREQAEPKEQKTKGPGHDLPSIISAPALMAKVLPPLQFAVNELLPVGYTVLAGPPKLGKSWLLSQLALAVASGSDLFGQGTLQGHVLQLALEDGERRMQSRMDRLLNGSKAPEDLHIATKWPRLDLGGMAEIEMWAKSHGDAARLCIIDTLQKIRPPASKAGNAYEQDYELHGQLHGLAHRLGIALISVTHMRKGAAGGDWVEGVIGSGGITGSADTIMVLKRDRGAADAFLQVTGRDVREAELALRSDEGMWSCLGSAQAVRFNETQRRILDALAEGGDRGLLPREAAGLAELKPDLVRQTLKRLVAAGVVTEKGGRYARRVA
jgi:hypothetical protein